MELFLRINTYGIMWKEQKILDYVYLSENTWFGIMIWKYLIMWKDLKKNLFTSNIQKIRNNV